MNSGASSQPPIIVGGGYTLEKLEGTKNYNNWKFAMKMSLIMDGLWNCILGTDTDATRDQRALAKICLNVQSACYAYIREANTSKEAWNNLQAAFEGKSLCRRLSLLRRLLRIKYEDFKSMDDYVSGLVSLVQQLADIGHKVDDEEVAMLLLGGLPIEFDPLVMGMEATHDRLSSETVKARLLSEDYRRVSGEVDTGDTALAVKKTTNHSKKLICHRCGKEGHIKPKCPQFKKEKKKQPKDLSKKDEDKLLLATSFAVGSFDKNSWYIDSGCTTHMSMRRDWFSKCSDHESKEIVIANNQKLHSKGAGNVKVNLKNNSERIITDVIYVPGIAANLLSVNKMTEKGLIVVFDKEKCYIYNKSDCKIQGRSKVSASKINGIYRLDQPNTSSEKLNEESTAMLTTMVSKNIWHKRLAHLSQKNMSKLRKGLATGINFLEDDKLEDCIPCIQGKQKRNSFPTGNIKRAKEKLELIHSDLCGPMSEVTWGGARYLLMFTDDHSRKTFGYVIKSKKQVLEKFIEFKTLVENQTNLRIKKIRTDNGLEYCNYPFENYLKKYGIIHETTVPYTPEQNGVSERMNRTIIEKARSILQDSGLNKKFWGEAVMTAIYVKNRSPTAAIPEATPEELWSGSKIDISNLRVFGCKAYVHIPKELRRKLDPKSKEYVMVGYCEHTKGYRLADLSQAGKVIKARDVIFLENIEKKKTLNSDAESSVNIDMFSSPEEVSMNNEATNVNSDTEDSNEDLDLYQSMDSSWHSDSTDEDDEQKKRNFNTDERPKREARKPCWTKDYVMSTVSFDNVIVDEPQTFKEAISCTFKDKWIDAMKCEYKSLIEKNVWTLVERPKNSNVVKNKWVYKLKRDPSGNIEKFKARLVARGFSQVQGIDFNETFAPVVRYSTLRLLFAIANERDMDINHLDVTTAFLNSNLDECIYMEQPCGFENESKNKVCLLNKSIYGLKQASRTWNQTIHKILTSIGYVRSKCEPCIYIKRNEEVLIIIAIYVDDFFVFSNSKMEKQKLINQLKEEFDVKDLGPVTNCLGMKVNRDRNNGTLNLSQSQYIKNLLTKFGMAEAKPATTPMAVNTKFEKGSKDNNKYPYQQLIGGLLHLAVCTRPDIAYATSILSQFNTCYDDSHWIGAKRILRYLAGTINYGLVFERKEKGIAIYADSDWAGDIIDRRSYSGLVVKFGNCAITWESKKQKPIAMSSAEAEYLSMCNATKEAMFMRNLLSEIHGKANTLLIYNDNQSAQKIISNQQYHNRTKHIDLRYHFIRDAFENGIIDIKYKPTDDMVADALTKPLSSVKHDLYVKELGLRCV